MPVTMMENMTSLQTSKRSSKEKHPKAAELKQSAITDKPEIKTERVIFENITQDDITSTTKNSSGSAD